MGRLNDHAAWSQRSRARSPAFRQFRSISRGGAETPRERGKGESREAGTGQKPDWRGELRRARLGGRKTIHWFTRRRKGKKAIEPFGPMYHIPGIGMEKGGDSSDSFRPERQARTLRPAGRLQRGINYSLRKKRVYCHQRAQLGRHGPCNLSFHDALNHSEAYFRCHSRGYHRSLCGLFVAGWPDLVGRVLRCSSRYRHVIDRERSFAPLMELLLRFLGNLRMTLGLRVKRPTNL